MLESSFGIIPLSQVDGEWRVFLVLHLSGHHWAFPKGKSNSGETPLATAERELREETGLEVVSLLKKEPLVENYQFKREGKVVKKNVSYFLAKVRGEISLQAEEIAEGRWFGLEEAHKILTFPEAKKICAQAIECLKC